MQQRVSGSFGVGIVAFGTMVFFCVVFWGAGVAEAKDTWSTPYPGIRYLHRSTTQPKEIHALVVDLKHPTISLRASTPADRGLTPGAFASKIGAAAVVNGDFFDGRLQPVGLAVGNGTHWSKTADSAKWSFLACDKYNRCEIDLSGKAVPRKPSWHNVVGGYTTLIQNGVVRTAAQDSACGSFCTGLHPRTAVGLSQDGHTLYLVMVEGRRSPIYGLKLHDLAVLLKGLGAYQGLNFDGGGSSGMVLKGKLANKRPSNEPNERRVSNHLAVMVDPSRKLAATLVEQGSDIKKNSPGGTLLLCPAQKFSLFVRLRNTGTLDWQDQDIARPGQAVGLVHKSGEPFGNPARISLSQADDQQVQPGEIVTFRLQGQAPPQPGDVTSQWQLQSKEVQDFGPLLQWKLQISNTPGQQSCDTGQEGLCREGILSCTAQGSLKCRPLRTPQAERCNGKDDDCDGSVDEGCSAEPPTETPQEPPKDPPAPEPGTEPLPETERRIEPSRGEAVREGSGIIVIDAGLFEMQRENRPPQDCACQSASTAPSSLWWLLLLLPFLRRRPPTPRRWSPDQGHRPTSPRDRPGDH